MYSTADAQQLVAERRASFEAIAFRRQFRRFLSRGMAGVAPTAPVVAPAPRSPITMTARRRATADATHVSKVA